MKRKTISLLAALLFYGVVAQSQNNQEFLKNQFLILDEVLPLTQAEREKMDSIFNAEFAVFKIRDIAFNLAISKTLENPDYYIHYYKDEIAKRAYFLYCDDLAYYRKKMKLNESSLASIKSHLKERSEEIALCDVMFFAFPDEFFYSKEAIKKKYDRDISDIYIKNESKGVNYDIGLALQNRKQLNLSEQQIDAFVLAARTVSQLTETEIITEKRNNRWLYEREYIIETLNEEQTSDFAILRSSDEAAKYAIDLWNEAKLYEIEYDRDSIQILNELFSYQINKLKIQYIYYHNKKKMKEMEEFWYKEAYPNFLRLLAVELRRRQAEEINDKGELRF
jgi:hypothetical protein